MSNDGLSRRGVLRRGAATASAATLASLAGCSSVPLVGGGGGGTQWLYEPGAIADREHYRFFDINLKTIRNNKDNFSDQTYSFFEGIESSYSDTGIGFDSMNSYLSIGGFSGSQSVVSGSFNNGDVKSELEDSDKNFDSSDYKGYTIYYSEDAGVAYAVGSSLLKTGPAGNEDAEAVAELLVDTKKGNEDRYKAESDAMKKFLNVAGSPTLVSGGTQEPREEGNPEKGQFQNVVARGSTGNVKGKNTIEQWIRVFESKDDVNKSDFEDWTDASDQFDNTENIKINQKGRAVVVKGRTPTDEL